MQTIGREMKRGTSNGAAEKKWRKSREKTDSVWNQCGEKAKQKEH